MNLAVHGLTGEIAETITYYEDKHNLVGVADFVMANPPFNVDLVDDERIICGAGPAPGSRPSSRRHESVATSHR